MVPVENAVLNRTADAIRLLSVMKRLMGAAQHSGTICNDTGDSLITVRSRRLRRAASIETERLSFCNPPHRTRYQRSFVYGDEWNSTRELSIRARRFSSCSAYLSIGAGAIGQRAIRNLETSCSSFATSDRRPEPVTTIQIGGMASSSSGLQRIAQTWLNL